MKPGFLTSLTKRAPVSLCAIALMALSCQTARPTAQPQRVITDELGRTISVGLDPRRIVSLAPSITETLFALGAGDRIVGVTTYCDYPPEAAQKDKVGDTLRPSVEKIIALKPDLAIISTSSQLESYLQKLEEVGIPVYINNPRNIDEAISSIEKIGELAGAGSQGRELAASLRARVAAVRAGAATEKKPVLFLLGTDPLIVPGGSTFINDMIEKAGGQSISSDLKADYPQFSPETAVARAPQVIFLQAGESELPTALKQTPAAESGRVYRIDDALLLRPGPRIVDGLEQMARKILQ